MSANQSDVCRGRQGGMKALPEKEITMTKKSKTNPGKPLSGESKEPLKNVTAISTNQASAASKKLADAATKRKSPSKPATASRAATDKLVCRYCGSDDLAPSFIKRRDARCRACFKRRYGGASKAKRPTAA